jgi:hypothetical protein
MAVGFATKKKMLLQVVPTFTWFALMTLPFIFTRDFFSVSTQVAQSAGILIIATALSFGDTVATNIKFTQRFTDLPASHKPSSILIFIFSGLVVIVPLCHFFLVGSIPIFDQIFHGMSPNAVSVEREDFVKLLDVPYLIKVLFNWVPSVFGPICVTWFWVNHRKFISVGLFIWVLFYSITSSASGPIFLLIWTLVFTASYAVFRGRSIGNLLAVGISGALLFCVASGVWLGSTATHIASDCLDSSFKTYTPGDVFRGCQNEPGVWINPIVNRAGYRIFLTPVEVSNHWYDYFDGDPSEKRNFLDIFERTNSKQASNKVGVWAYTDRFPGSYGKTISANGSIDADAFSLGGLLAIAIVALLLLIIRVFISVSYSGDLLLAKILEGVGLAQLAFMPSSAPLQAILLPQGLALILFLLLVLRGKSLWAAFYTKVN